MRCLLCMKEMGKGSIRDVLFEEDIICEECRKQWEEKDISFMLDGIRVRSDYVYNDAFSSCLVQYKECFDEALKDVFLYRKKKKIKRMYRGYTLCMMPSGRKKMEERGFSHLACMFECVGLPVIEPFNKKDERDQKQKGFMERRKMINNIVLKKGVNLPKKIVLCDDTLTTGATLKGALSAFDLTKHDVEIYCVSANKGWLKNYC